MNEGFNSRISIKLYGHGTEINDLLFFFNYRMLEMTENM